MKNLTKTQKVMLFVALGVLLTSAATTGSVFGVKKYKAKKAAKVPAETK